MFGNFLNTLANVAANIITNPKFNFVQRAAKTVQWLSKVAARYTGAQQQQSLNTPTSQQVSSPVTTLTPAKQRERLRQKEIAQQRELDKKAAKFDQGVALKTAYGDNHKQPLRYSADIRWLGDKEAQKVIQMMQDAPALVDVMLSIAPSPKAAFDFLLAQGVDLPSETISKIVGKHYEKVNYNQILFQEIDSGVPPDERLMPEIDEITRRAIILAIMQEAGGLDEDQKLIVMQAIINRMMLPVGSYTGHWNIVAQINTGKVANYVLNGMRGETREEQINNAYAYYQEHKPEFGDSLNFVDDFLANPREDETGGAISWIHIDSNDLTPQQRKDRAEAIANRINELGQACIERIMRESGVDPIINGERMVAWHEGITVYINMNYNIPSTDIINCPSE